MSSPNMTPFCGNKQKVEIQTCAYCASAVHMETQATHSMCSTKQESKILSLKNRKDLGMASHTPPLKKKKAQKQGEVPLPFLSPIPNPIPIPKFSIS